MRVALLFITREPLYAMPTLVSAVELKYTELVTKSYRGSHALVVTDTKFDAETWSYHFETYASLPANHSIRDCAPTMVCPIDWPVEVMMTLITLPPIDMYTSAVVLSLILRTSIQGPPYDRDRARVA